MGIKTSITSEQLPSKYQQYQLIPTSNGVMATVYLLGDSYVLKLFEKKTSLKSIESEITLLQSLQNLPLPKVIDQFSINGHHVVIYTQIQGEIHFQTQNSDLYKLGSFLKDFHQQSANIYIDSPKIFEKQKLQNLISKSKNPLFQNLYDEIELELKEDGVIHGDLFPDNCKFLGKKLSGVYDFSDACRGDFMFELAVIVVAWCYDDATLNKQKVDTLFSAYGKSEPSNFSAYINYALLYYATNRYLAKRNYQELLNRFKSLVS